MFYSNILGASHEVLVAVLHFYPVETPHNATGSFEVMVRPDQRRKGYGRQLIGEMLKHWPDCDLNSQHYTVEGAALIADWRRHEPLNASGRTIPHWELQRGLHTSDSVGAE